jgi:transcriptional regulator with PAS, ATPase and Fis domain
MPCVAAALARLTNYVAEGDYTSAHTLACSPQIESLGSHLVQIQPLQAARARGRLGGRPKVKTLDTPKKVALAQSLYDNKSTTIDEICKTLNISRATLYRYIQTPKASVDKG